jgi:hypothetical protein
MSEQRAIITIHLQSPSKSFLLSHKEYSWKTFSLKLMDNFFHPIKFMKTYWLLTTIPQGSTYLYEKILWNKVESNSLD